MDGRCNGDSGPVGLAQRAAEALSREEVGPSERWEWTWTPTPAERLTLMPAKGEAAPLL